jgi:sporulation protein YlmC with PRC-barrel domain
MLQSINDLMGYRIAAADGEIGTVADVLFDDRSSAVRYYVVDTGTWLSGRQVLLPPAVFGAPDRSERRLPTALTRQQVESSPDIATDEPVSRQLEESMHAHYGWEPYWRFGTPVLAAPWTGGLAVLGPAIPESDSAAAREARARIEEGQDPNLRSANEVIGYYVKARDGDIGHVEDLLLDDEQAMIRYLVIDTRNWLPGRKVLVSTQWLSDVDWSENRVTVDLTRAEIESSPEYDPHGLFDRDAETRLHEHYRRRAYWV